jgi:hypothetical protein
VPIGSIEARLGELSVGIGSLRNGEARVTAIFAAGRALDLTVRAVYVPAAPWWEPGAPGVIAVTVRPGTPWRRIAFSVLALALVAWVIREAYDFRPFRRSRVATEKPKLAEPVGRAEVVRPRAPREGWAGVVFDAHEGAPIRGAAIAVVLAGFPGADGSTGTRVLAERIADDAGQFALAEPAFPRGALLRISAPTHGPIEIPLPPPSDLSIAMVSRKRNLLERVVKFALREWGAWDDSRRDPTPDQVARRARREADPIASDGRAKQIEAYARATESAAFGPGTVDASTETEVLGLEPR